jgi:transcriptional regulator with GAF, ATPase, and Fis domain
MARLVVREDRSARPVELGDDPIVVGSGPKCGLRLEGEGVQARHLVVERSARGWRMRSTVSGDAAVKVNGRRMATRRLRNGDRLELGTVTIEFEDRKTAPAGRTQKTATAAAPRHAAPDEIARLRTTLGALANETDFKKLLTLIVDQVISLTSAERGFLILRGAREKYEMQAARTLDRENVRRPGLKISRAVAEEVARTGQPLLTTNAQADARLRDSQSVEGMRLRSVLCVPLRARGRFLGFLYLDHRFEEGAFRPDDLDLVQAFADQAAVALEDLRLLAELRARTEELEHSKTRVEELNRLLEERVQRQSQELSEVRTLLREKGDAALKYSYDSIVGRSRLLRDALRLVDHVTDSSVPVLILGESGTGKELVARAIYRNGPRKDRPFVAENCAAIPESLIESVLFGHVKGAFTGADRDREGLFELADGGTLFLDEIGDLPPSVQVRLLRVLESGELRRIGGKRTVMVDVRIISATNRDLARLVEEGRFREDLLYRINVLEVRLPPLRERREDVPELVRHFLDLQAREAGAEPKTVSDEALALLVGYDWPGNVRQLRNEVRRAVALADQVILPEVLSEEIATQAVPVPATLGAGDKGLRELVQEAVDVVERRLVEEALARTGWHKGEAARILQVSRPTLDAKIRRHDLTRPSG